MLTVTQRLMSGLGQAGSDWAWSMSINDNSYSPLQTQVASDTSVTEEPVSEPKTTHDHSSGTSALQDLYDYYSENLR